MNIALILSGGNGTRIGGGIPKQYISVAGKPVIAYCLETFARHPEIDRIQAAAQEDWHGLIQKCCGGSVYRFSKPGETRQLSICNGLQDIMAYAAPSDKVIIHDAARPLVSRQAIHGCLEALELHEGVVPALPMKDTVYEGAGGRILSLLDRSRIVAGQAPEGFLLGKYYEANKALLPDKILSVNGSAEAAVLAGMDVVYIQGEERNFKITTAADLERFRDMMEKERYKEQ